MGLELSAGIWVTEEYLPMGCKHTVPQMGSEKRNSQSCGINPSGLPCIEVPECGVPLKFFSNTTFPIPFSDLAYSSWIILKTIHFINIANFCMDFYLKPTKLKIHVSFLDSKVNAHILSVDL